MKTISFFLAVTCFSGFAFGDDVRYLKSPDQSLSAILGSIREAKSSVELATFIFEPCEASGQLVLEALAERARAGVKTRVLIDAFRQNSRTRAIMSSFLSRAGISYRLFNDSVDPSINFRMHSKFLVVDGQTLIAGGRNIADGYFGLSNDFNYVDRDLMAVGRTGRQAVALFNELWSSSLVSTPAKVSSVVPRDLGRACGKSLEGLKSRILAQLATRPDLAIPSRACKDVAFVNDAPDFSDPKYGMNDDNYMSEARASRKRTSTAILQFIRGSKSSLRVENWMYAPLSELSAALDEIRNRDVKIEVLTNLDMEEGPDFFKQAEEYAITISAERDSTRRQTVGRVSSRGRLRSAWALTPNVPSFIHGKVMMRDDRDAVVSSFNMDARSQSANVEAATSVKNCPALVSDVRSGFDEILAQMKIDEREGKIAAKPEPSLAAKIFALANLVSF